MTTPQEEADRLIELFLSGSRNEWEAAINAAKCVQEILNSVPKIQGRKPSKLQLAQSRQYGAQRQYWQQVLNELKSQI